ncbi:hypothetical protein [Prosthecobacter sp.]|uniref:hypothetical protein n=1 Tax=Prosthecobacter sp. TaxID=1965333 RepID=UPI003783C745
MLDLRHPLSQHIFKASGLIGQIMGREQKMSVSPTKKRIELLHECQAIFGELRNLASREFASKKLRCFVAISEYKSAITDLASVQTDEDRSCGVGECGVCGTPLTRFPPPKSWKEYKDHYHWLICCNTCTDACTRAMLKVSSAFGTDAI